MEFSIEVPQEVDLGGAIYPSKCCPHVLGSLNLKTAATFSVLTESLVNPCGECDSTKENWMCLSCGLVSCSRYQNSHGEAHWLEKMCSASADSALAPSLSPDTHCLALSFSDLNVWCYECGSYIKHSALIPLLVEAEATKFACAPKEHLLAHSRNRTGYHTAVILPTNKMDAHCVDGSRGSAASDERPLRTQKILEKLNGCRGSGDSNTLCDVMTVRTTANESNKCRVLAAIQAVHTKEMVDAVRDASAAAATSAAAPAADMFYSPGTFDAAVDAVASCVTMVDTIFSSRNAAVSASPTCYGDEDCGDHLPLAPHGKIDRGLCVVRPPGHHATRTSPGGFCVFNNVAIAASYAREKYLSSRSRESLLRAALIEFYITYAPDEVGKVGNLVQRVIGGPPTEVGGITVGGILWTEEELFGKLEDKYGGKVVRPSTTTSVNSGETETSGKLLIVDLDIHHGNGTQDIFYEDPSVITVSIHRQKWVHGEAQDGREVVELPEEGRLEFTGSGAGVGCNINIPLRNIPTDEVPSPKPHSDADYAYIFNELVLPLVDSVQPDLVLVALGFDASMYDSSRNQGGYLLSSQIYNYMMQSLSYRTKHGRVLATLEGGYDDNGLAVNVDSVLKAMSSIDVGPKGPPSSPRVFADSVDRTTGAISCDLNLVLKSTKDVVSEVKAAFSANGYFSGEDAM